MRSNSNIRDSFFSTLVYYCLSEEQGTCESALFLLYKPNQYHHFSGL